MANPTVDDSATISPENRICLSDCRLLAGLHARIFYPIILRYLVPHMNQLKLCDAGNLPDSPCRGPDRQGDVLCRSFHHD
jgi:hypothetical protein